MPSVTPLTSFPSASTGFVAITTATGKVKISASRAMVAGERIAYHLLRWDSTASKAYPVQEIALDDTDVGGAKELTFDSDGSSYHLLQKSGGVNGLTFTTRIDTITSGSRTVGLMHEWINPAAASTTGVHAALAGNAAPAFPGPFTSPAVPRNVTATFAGSYDGGDITFVGTRLGQVQTETIVASAGSTVAGTKIFDTVTSASRSTTGATANTVSLGWGEKLGTPWAFTGVQGLFYVDGVLQTDHTMDGTNYGVTPHSGDVANGTKDYLLIVKE